MQDQRVTAPDLQTKAGSLPQPCPDSRRAVAVTVRPHIRGGELHLGGSWGGVGVGTAQLSKAPPPPEPLLVRVGTGPLMRVVKVLFLSFFWGFWLL